MPLLPASLIEPLWVEFAALIGTDERPEFVPDHPWGCHRRRIPDRVVFDHLIGTFVHGSGYERLATTNCLDRTMRRRLFFLRQKHDQPRAALVITGGSRADTHSGTRG